MTHRCRIDNCISQFCALFPQLFLKRERSLPYGVMVLSLDHIPPIAHDFKPAGSLMVFVGARAQFKGLPMFILWLRWGRLVM